MAKETVKKMASTKRLSKEMEAGLNAQLTKEAHAAQIYLSLGVWADGEGYAGISNFLFRHAQEERNHMTKVLEYILSRGGKVIIAAIPASTPDPVSVNDCFQTVFTSEVDNTTAIYALVTLSQKENDWATWNFLQWFVQEQIEEETLALDLLDKIKIAGGENATDAVLYELDKDLGKEPDSAALARTATASNPV